MKVLVGHRSVIMEGAKLEDGCAIGPNSVVPPGRIIPANQLWAGNPVQYICDREEVITNQVILERRLLDEGPYDNGVVECLLS